MDHLSCQIVSEPAFQELLHESSRRPLLPSEVTDRSVAGYTAQDVWNTLTRMRQTLGVFSRD